MAEQKKPRKVICTFKGRNDSFVCEADEEGFGRCGDELEECLWIKEVLEFDEEVNATEV